MISKTDKIFHQNDIDENLNLNSKQVYIIGELDLLIEKYLNDVDKLWNNIILEYKNNIYYGILLDKLNDRSKFYDLMTSSPAFLSLTNTRRKLRRMTIKNQN